MGSPTASVLLTHGKIALVDSSDLPILAQFRWYAARDRHKAGDRFYAQCGKYLGGGRKHQIRRTIKMHRYILGLQPGDKRQVDHINGDTLDNRRCNLRICSKTQNSWNSPKENNKSSIYKGVHYNRSRKPMHRRWRASIRASGKIIRLGSFATEIEAAVAYNRAAQKYHREYASLNKVDQV